MTLEGSDLIQQTKAPILDAKDDVIARVVQVFKSDEAGYATYLGRRSSLSLMKCAGKKLKTTKGFIKVAIKNGNIS